MLTGQVVESGTPQLRVPGQKFIERLSFTHLAELIAIDDPLKRAFYEIECIRGNWSVRELKRQIGSLYHERSGLSIDKEELADLAQSGAEQSMCLIVSVSVAATGVAVVSALSWIFSDVCTLWGQFQYGSN